MVAAVRDSSPYEEEEEQSDEDGNGAYGKNGYVVDAQFLTESSWLLPRRS